MKLFIPILFFMAICLQALPQAIWFSRDYRKCIKPIIKNVRGCMTGKKIEKKLVKIA